MLSIGTFFRLYFQLVKIEKSPTVYDKYAKNQEIDDTFSVKSNKMLETLSREVLYFKVRLYHILINIK